MSLPEPHWCSHCGLALEAGDNGLSRCPEGHEHYRPRPQILVSCFLSCRDKLLWMRRNNDPQRGFWAIPAGYMEAGETLAQACARELYEETCIELPPSALQLYMAGTISYISQIYIAFRARVATECGSCGPEAQEIAWFAHADVPWPEVAYPDANNAIEQAYRDLQHGSYPLRHSIMTDQVNQLRTVRPDKFK